MSKFFKSITSVMVFAIVISFSTVASADTNDVEITKANFYAAWGMSTLQNVEITNNTNSTLKNIEIEIKYKNSYSNEDQVAMITLPVEVPPNSKAKYLQEGLKKLLVNPAGSGGMHTGGSKIDLANSNVKVVRIELTKEDLHS